VKMKVNQRTVERLTVRWTSSSGNSQFCRSHVTEFWPIMTTDVVVRDATMYNTLNWRQHHTVTETQLTTFQYYPRNSSTTVRKSNQDGVVSRMVFRWDQATTWIS